MADVVSELSFDEERLSLEQQAMNESFPEATLVELSGLESPLGWRLGIVIADTVHELLVAYQQQFPEEPPELWVLNPEFDINQTPHVTPDGRLVLPSHIDHEWTASGTAATGVTLAASWLHGRRASANGEPFELDVMTCDSVEAVEPTTNPSPDD